jgi:hypothetical protein
MLEQPFELVDECTIRRALQAGPHPDPPVR